MSIPTNIQLIFSWLVGAASGIIFTYQTMQIWKQNLKIQPKTKGGVENADVGG